MQKWYWYDDSVKSMNFFFFFWETLLLTPSDLITQNINSVTVATRYLSHRNASPDPTRLKTDHFSSSSTSNMNKLF